MKIEIKLLIFIVIGFNIHSIKSQNDLQKFNQLPHTIEVRAPEFNTEKKYFFKMDTINHSLIIQDLRMSKDGTVHFYQFLHEIPLGELNSESFKIQKDFDEITIDISSAPDKISIMTYMFQEGKVSSIQASNTISLGNWTYSDHLFSQIEQAIKTISATLPQGSPTMATTKRIPGKFKFIDKNVMQVNAHLDDDLRIWNAYHYAPIIDDNGQYLHPKIVESVKRALKAQNDPSPYPIPVMVYTNAKGVIENIAVANNLAESSGHIEGTEGNPMTIKTENGQPSKYVFLLN